jgi:hypothetical protein
MIRASRRTSGLLLVLLGAWGGIVPFVGPAFNYRMDATSSWTWTTAHWELNLAPGAACVIAGLVMLSGRRAHTALAGLLAAAAGAWFVLGPMFASMWLGPEQTRVASTDLGNAIQPLGYHYGLGVLIVFIAAAMLAVRDSVVTSDAGTYPTSHRAAPGTTVPSEQDQPTTATTTTATT